MSSTRNTTIEAFRFIFMVIICYWHYHGSAGIFRHGYLAVEFFFILSGWLLYNSFCKENALSTVDYTWRKFKRFAPEYLLVLTYIYLRHGILPVVAGNRQIDVEFLMRMVPEALMIQDCGIYLGGANSPLWYLCILLVGGGLIYSMLRFHHRLAINIFMPFLCLMGFTYIFGKSVNGSIEVWDVENGINATMVRGMADMSLGVLACYLFKIRGNNIKEHLLSLNLISLISIFLVAYIIFTKPYFDRYILILIPPILLASFIEKSIINMAFRSRLWICMGGLSYEMLLVHFRVALPIHETIMQIVYFPLWADYLVYLAIVIACSFILKIIHEQYKRCQLFQL